MLDNQLIALIGQILTSGLGGIAGLEAIAIKQANQPTQQGANSAPTIYLTKIGDKRIGTMARKAVWVPNEADSISTESGDIITEESGNPIGIDDGLPPTGTMVYTQLQQYESTFQLSALATQDPADLTGLTASDILNYAAWVMQSEDCITTLEAQGIGILRVADIRNPPFSDDRQRFEYIPSFDFTLTHKQTIVKTAPVIKTEEFQILPV